MKIKPPKFLGVWDLHKKIMIVRTAVEAGLFLTFVGFSNIIPWLKKLPHLTGLTWCWCIVLSLSLLYLFLTIYKERKKQDIKIITYLESITDAIMTLPLLHFIGGINGPLFFFYSLMIMESAATFSDVVIFLVAGIGGIAVIGDLVYRLLQEIIIFTPAILIVMFFRLIFLFLISFYGHFLSKSILNEKEARKDLSQAYKELKKVDEAKSEFIAMASHQLRTPLSAIKGYASMILEGTYNHLSEKAKKPVKSIYISNERLVAIVESLLDVSKIEMGKMETEKEKTRIENIIDEVYEEMELEVKKKNLKFTWKKPKTSLPELEIDRLKIRQVILNLIDNASRYTKDGEIEIKAKEVDSKIQISVRDTGEGLTQEEGRTIFEAFTRGAAGITHWIQGAGLGLYLARRYIELHHGKIWAESQGKGKGSTFYVELPLK